MFECTLCDKKYAHKRDLNRHVSTAHENREFKCPKCQKTFTRKYTLANHLKATQCSTKRKASVDPEPAAKRPRMFPPTNPLADLLKFDINDYGPDTHETINQNRRWVMPFAKTNRKIMDTYNVPLVDYDHEKIARALETIYHSQRYSFKVCDFCYVFFVEMVANLKLSGFVSGVFQLNVF